MREERKERIKKAGILVFWLLAWQLVSLCVQNPLVFVGPAETARAFLTQMGSGRFWQTIAGSAARIAAGFLLAFSAGFLAGGLASRFSFIKDLLAPLVLLMKAVPVASFVILVLIWLGVKGLTLTISFLVVFPIIYQSTLTGFASADPQLTEMARVFRLSSWKRYLYIYRPAVLPALTDGCRTALGMSWKSGVAAEVIGTPDFSIGAELYLAKIYFSTADLFAWTAVIILMSLCFEKVFLWMMKRAARPFGGLLLRKTGEAAARQGSPIRVTGLCKAYQGRPVFQDLDLTLEAGRVYGLMAPSGSGKTTLFRIWMGLEEADGGKTEGLAGEKMSAVFQEDRLCPALTALENAQIAGGSADLGQILPADALTKKAAELSGGMKRRTAIARAMAAESSVILMDEPFTGLDEETKNRVVRYIREHRNGRTLVFTTHDREDLSRMGAGQISLDGYPAAGPSEDRCV
jgi:NitT/TauT family transport system permease protein